MTAVVAARSGGKVCIGGDSAMTWPDTFEQSLERPAKVRQRGAWLIGVSGEARLAQLAVELWEPAAPPRRMSLGWLIANPIEELRVMIDAYGIPDKKVQPSLLLAVQGRIFQVQEDWSVIEPRAPYAAIGTGGSYALGACHAALAHAKAAGMRKTCHPAYFVREGLAAAATHCASVSAPFTVLTV